MKSRRDFLKTMGMGIAACAILSVPSFARCTSKPTGFPRFTPDGQFMYESFIIKDEEASISFSECHRKHMEAAAKETVKHVDRAILGRVTHELRMGTSYLDPDLEVLMLS